MENEAYVVQAQKQGHDLVKAFVKATDNEGNTALHLAAQNGSLNVSIIYVLLLSQSSELEFDMWYKP